MVMYMGGSLLMIAAIYYWSLEMFEKEMKYHFSLRTFIKKGLRISGLIGIFAALSVILQIAVFGNEVFGVNDLFIKSADYSLEIPQFGTKHSLNVSVCMGIISYDFVSKLNV